MSLDDYFPFKDLPWLRGTLAEIVVWMGLWLLGALVAMLLLPVLVRAQSALGTLLDHLAVWARERRSARRQAAVERRTLTARASLRSAITGDTLGGAASSLSALRAQVGANLDAVKQVLDDLGLNLKRLVPAGPAGAADPLELLKARKARMYLAVSSVLLLCFATVNTGMLSEILKDLAIVPQNIRVGSLELRYVFAFILTLAEAGIGFLHGVFSERVTPEDEERRFRLPALLTSVGALLVAGVEGSFYAAIGGDKGEVPLLGVPFSWVFFAWGFVLVMTLFGLGIVWHRALFDARGGSLAFLMRKRLKDLGTHLDSYARDLTTVEQQRAKIEQGLTTLSARLAISTPEGAESVTLGANDLGPLEARTVVIALLTLVSGVAFFVVWRQVLQSLYRLTDWQFDLVAAGHTVVFLTAGLLLPAAAGSTDRHRRTTVIAMLCLAVAAGAYLAVGYRAWGAGFVNVWLLAMSIAMILVFAGRELAGVIGLLPLELTLLGHAVLTALTFVPIWLGRLLWLVLGFIRFVFEILRAPFLWRRSAGM